MPPANNVRANVEITASARNVQGVLNDTRRKFNRFAETIKDRFSRVHAQRSDRSGFSPITGALGTFGGNMMTKGFDALVDAGRAVFDFETRMTRLMIATERAPEQMDSFRKAVRKAGEDVGISAEQVLAGAEEYVKLTGDMNGAEQALGSFANIAQASGAAMADVATSAAAMQQNLKINPKDFEAGFSAMIVQGKAGSIELKDMAQELAGIAPVMAQFAGGTGLEGLREMGAVMQVVRRGFANSAEAATGFQALTTSIGKRAHNLENAGVRIYDKDPKTGVKHLRNFSDIIKSISKSKLMKDDTALRKALGSIEAYRAFKQLEANLGLMDELKRKAEDTGAVQRDLQKFMESGPGKVARAWEKTKNVIAEAFTPERIQRFADAAIAAGEAFASAIEGAAAFMDNIDHAAKMLAKFIGGESEEDRVAGVQRERLKERVDFLGNSKGMSEDQALSRIAKENALQDTMLGHRNSAETGKAFTVQELLMLRKQVIPGTSDEKRLMDVNETALIKAFEAGFAQIAGALASGGTVGVGGTFQKPGGRAGEPGVLVKVGADTVVKAQRTAKNHRSRPGG